MACTDGRSTPPCKLVRGNSSNTPAAPLAACPALSRHVASRHCEIYPLFNTHTPSPPSLPPSLPTISSPFPEVPTAPIRPYNPTLVAVARKFEALNVTKVASTFLLPVMPSNKEKVTIKGYVNLYSYLSNNCTNAPQAALCPSLNFSHQKKVAGKWKWTPYGYSNKLAYGYGFTGERKGRRATWRRRGAGRNAGAPAALAPFAGH